VTPAHLAFPLGAASCLVLAAWASLRGQGDRERIALPAGAVAFALEAVAAWVLVAWTHSPEDREFWLNVVTMMGIVVLVPWMAFIASLLASASRARPGAWRLAAWLSAVFVTAAMATPWLGECFLLVQDSGPFHAAPLTALGIWAVVPQVLGTVAILSGLELCLRTATREARWRLKFLVLGIGGLFLLRFYLLSHVLLFHVFLAASLTTHAAALALATVAIGISVRRAPLTAPGFTMSRSLVLRSAMVGLLGLYLFVIGGLGWLLDRLGMSDELFWGSLLVFVGGALGGALVLSEHARWRVKHFVSLHFYGNKYDYRTQWMTFTRRLGSTVAVEDLAPQVLSATLDAIGSAKGSLYVATSDGFQHAASQEVFNAPTALDDRDDLVARARRHTIPVAIHAHERPVWFRQAALLVPLVWQGQLTGFMLVAGERGNAPYGSEDLEFFATVTVQIAAAIVTSKLSETVARTREFETFHRLTSFVAHDLKNAVSSLSLLSANALRHFDDPEFQRDALATLSKTVDRMRTLLQRLASTAEVPTLERQPLDLAVLIAERIVPLARAPHVTLLLELRPAPCLGDPESIERVFHNLLINAIEALDGHGEVAIRSRVQDGAALCEVSDTGCGMSFDFVRRSLFEPFRSSKKGGWGIGLYHAREIVRAHRGRIDVRTEEGRGTTFTVTFPLPPVAEPA
jgi:putative PEP-CTERM system histidine kinase